MKKTCTSCSREKDLSGFARDRSRVGGYHAHCKVCRRAAASVKYSMTEVETRRVRDRARVVQTSLLLSMKKAGGCEKCDEKEPICLDLHHRDPTQKDFGVANYRNASTAKFGAELDKCAVLCANCHRKVHAGLIELGD